MSQYTCINADKISFDDILMPTHMIKNDFLLGKEYEKDSCRCSYGGPIN